MSLEEINSIIIDAKKQNKITNEFIAGLLNRFDAGKVLYCVKKCIPKHIELAPPIAEPPRYAQTEIRNDASFKKAVRARFPTCIICDAGECIPECGNVAHIWDFAKCDADSKYNPDNGLFMCANWHALFDAGILRLEPVSSVAGMVRITLADRLTGTGMYKYNGRMITLLPENIPFLEKRVKNRYIYS